MISSPAATNGPTDGAQPVPLTVLRAGTRATVHLREMCCEDCELLNAMGLTDRCTLRVCQAGSPCIVQAGGTRLGLTRHLAQRILVIPNDREMVGALD